MIKIKSGYRHIFTVAIVSLVLSGTGCSSLNKGLISNKSKRVDILEEKIDLLSISMESLNDTSNELRVKFDDLSVERNQLHEEYTQLIKKQSDIVSFQESQKAEQGLFKKELSETRKMIHEISQKLTSVETDKNNIKTQLKELSNLYSKSIGMKQGADLTAEVTKKPEVAKKNVSSPKEVPEKAKKTAIKNIEKTRKSAVKKTQEKLKLNLVEELLDKAIVLYRDGSFENAIAKWEEALALDPGKLEALFNIEIAQDRISEKQKSFKK